MRFGPINLGHLTSSIDRTSELSVVYCYAHPENSTTDRTSTMGSTINCNWAIAADFCELAAESDKMMLGPNTVAPGNVSAFLSRLVGFLCWGGFPRRCALNFRKYFTWFSKHYSYAAILEGVSLLKEYYQLVIHNTAPSSICLFLFSSFSDLKKHAQIVTQTLTPLVAVRYSMCRAVLAKCSFAWYMISLHKSQILYRVWASGTMHYLGSPSDGTWRQICVSAFLWYCNRGRALVMKYWNTENIVKKTTEIIFRAYLILQKIEYLHKQHIWSSTIAWVQCNPSRCALYNTITITQDGRRPAGGQPPANHRLVVLVWWPVTVLHVDNYHGVRARHEHHSLHTASLRVGCQRTQFWE